MVQEWLALLPREGGNGALAIAVAGMIMGLGLWIMGARHSRMIVTLIAVAAGGMLGMIAPRVLNWDVNTSTTALSMAMAFGAIGFCFTRSGVALGLIVILAFWASVGTWNLQHGGARLVLPRDCETMRDFCGALWTGLPDGVKSGLPFAVAGAAIVAVALTIIWGRMAAALLFSLTGVTLMLGMGLWALAMKGIEWPTFLPAHASMQALMITGMVVLGALVQWMPMKKRPVRGEAKAQAN